VRYQHRHNCRQNFAVVKTLYRCDKLDSIAENISSRYIAKLDIGNTLCINAVGIYVLSEYER
jgi:hypothetical protein